MHVLSPFDQRVTVTGADLPTLTTAAGPGEPNPSEHVASKLSVRLLQAYGADDDGMKGHAA